MDLLFRSFQGFGHGMGGPGYVLNSYGLALCGGIYFGLLGSLCLFGVGSYRG